MISSDVQTTVLTALTEHPQMMEWSIFFPALAVLFKKTKLSLKLGFSSKTLGSWSILIEHGKDETKTSQ